MTDHHDRSAKAQRALAPVPCTPEESVTILTFAEWQVGVGGAFPRSFGTAITSIEKDAETLN